MKKQFKYLKTFEALSRDRQSYIDSLLDKVSQTGMDSLTDIEKNNLDNIYDEEHEPVIKSQKEDMIDYIISIVKANDGYISMANIQEDASPVYKATEEQIDLIEFMDDATCEVVVYSTSDYDTVLNEYTVEYSELDIETLKHIYNIIKSNDLIKK